MTLWGALLVLLLVLTAPGCKSSKDKPPAAKVPPAKVGPSGVPEITVRVASEEALRAAFTEFFTQRGYGESTSRFTDELVFDRPLGPSEEATKAARVRVRYDRTADGRWRVVATAKSVEAWKSALESERTVTSAADQMQALLNAIQGRLNAQP